MAAEWAAALAEASSATPAASEVVTEVAPEQVSTPSFARRATST
jgi:flagellar motor switch protein FliN/FliY